MPVSPDMIRFGRDHWGASVERVSTPSDTSEAGWNLLLTGFRVWCESEEARSRLTFATERCIVDRAKHAIVSRSAG